MKKLNAFQLKVFALIIMLLDHLYFAFPDVFPIWIHPLSRVVAPIFAFLMVEGFFHTRNRLKYNIRLFGWAVFMQAGNTVLNILLASRDVHTGNNIFMTLAVGLAILSLFELSKKKNGTEKFVSLVGAILLIPAGFIFTEGGTCLIPFILITYFFRGNMKKAIIGYVILFVLLFVMSYVPYETLEMTINMLMFNSDFLFITVVPFMCLYNGERGANNRFTKYLFYVFYPLHLWILATIEFVLK